MEAVTVGKHTVRTDGPWVMIEERFETRPPSCSIVHSFIATDTVTMKTQLWDEETREGLTSDSSTVTLMTATVSEPYIFDTKEKAQAFTDAVRAAVGEAGLFRRGARP